MTQEYLTFKDFQEICDAKRDHFIGGLIDATSYRRFLTRNGFNATDADSELADAKAEKIRTSLTWYKSATDRRHQAFHIGQP